MLQARQLTLDVGGLRLLQEAEFEIAARQLVLVVGASGTGKTVLLKLLAGVARPGRRGLTATGELHFEEVDLLRRRPAPGRIGILFQDHALFDELDPVQNVLFALHHRRRRRSAPEDVAHAGVLLDELGVPRGTPVRHLSGGQRQRLALARTLALGPDLILYDEPSTGLDPANARRVAESIRTTHEQGSRTSLIVTHDAEAFLDVADRVLLLDPTEGKVLEIDTANARETLARLPRSEDQPRTIAPIPPPGLLRRFLESTTDALVASFLTLLHLLPLFPRWRYGLRYLRHDLKLAASAGAFAYVGVAGILVGFVATYFTFQHLPKRSFTEPLFIEDILTALGYMTYRVLVPVMVTLLVAARTGASLASDLGNRSFARQLDALVSFGVAPSRYLLTGALWSLLLSMPLLLATMYLAGTAVSLGAFLYTHPDHTAFFWSRNFHRVLAPDGFPYAGTAWVLAKVEVCALGTAAIAYFQGARDQASSSDVSSAVTRTIIAASLFVLVVHFVFAFLEF